MSHYVAMGSSFGAGPDTTLVTVTGGGNDVGYLPSLLLSSLPKPWTMGFRFGMRGAAYHPNVAGMAAVAELVVARIGIG
jgi:lysophospholipase L1-like esterase